MKKSLLIILTLLVLLSTGLQAKQKLSSEGTRALRDAKMKLQQKNFDKALEFYKNVLETDPECIEALIKIGQINYNLGSERTRNKISYYVESYKHYQLAVKAYDKLIAEGTPEKKLKSEKNDIDTLKNKEIDYPIQKILVIGQTAATEEEDYDAALEAYDIAYELNPDDVKPLQLKLAVYSSTKNDSMIINTLELITEKKPDDVNSLSNLAALYYNADNVEKSIDTYNKILVANPKDIDTMFNIAIAYSSQKNYEKALEYTEKVIELEPSNVDALDNAFEFAKALSNADKALKYGKKAADLNPNAERFEYLCYALSQAKKYDDLLVYAKKFHETAPEKKVAVQLVLLAAQQLDDKDTVAEYTKKMKTFEK